MVSEKWSQLIKNASSRIRSTRMKSSLSLYLLTFLVTTFLMATFLVITLFYHWGVSRVIRWKIFLANSKIGKNAKCWLNCDWTDGATTFLPLLYLYVHHLNMYMYINMILYTHVYDIIHTCIWYYTHMYMILYTHMYMYVHHHVAHWNVALVIRLNLAVHLLNKEANFQFE